MNEKKIYTECSSLRVVNQRDNYSKQTRRSDQKNIGGISSSTTMNLLLCHSLLLQQFYSAILKLTLCPVGTFDWWNHINKCISGSSGTFEAIMISEKCTMRSSGTPVTTKIFFATGHTSLRDVQSGRSFFHYQPIFL